MGVTTCVLWCSRVHAHTENNKQTSVFLKVPEKKGRKEGRRKEGGMEGRRKEGKKEGGREGRREEGGREGKREEGRKEKKERKKVSSLGSVVMNVALWRFGAGD